VSVRPNRPVAARHQVLAVAPQAEVDVPAVADAGGVDLRGERRAEPCALPTARIVARTSTEVSAASPPGTRGHRQLELPGGVLGVELLDGDALRGQCREHVAAVVEASARRDIP
jgi:hypothetical protein